MPPDWVIPVAWTETEAGMAGAVYRLVRAPASAQRSRVMQLLSWNILMIGGWSQLFFKRRNLVVSTAEAASTIATGVAFVRVAAGVDRPSGA